LSYPAKSRANKIIRPFYVFLLVSIGCHSSLPTLLPQYQLLHQFLGVSEGIRIGSELVSASEYGTTVLSYLYHGTMTILSFAVASLGVVFAVASLGVVFAVAGLAVVLIRNPLELMEDEFRTFAALVHVARRIIKATDTTTTTINGI
jgi:hypothetical protein